MALLFDGSLLVSSIERYLEMIKSNTKNISIKKWSTKNAAI